MNRQQVSLIPNQVGGIQGKNQSILMSPSLHNQSRKQFYTQELQNMQSWAQLNSKDMRSFQSQQSLQEVGQTTMQVDQPKRPSPPNRINIQTQQRIEEIKGIYKSQRQVQKNQLFNSQGNNTSKEVQPELVTPPFDQKHQYRTQAIHQSQNKNQLGTESVVNSQKAIRLNNLIKDQVQSYKMDTSIQNFGAARNSQSRNNTESTKFEPFQDLNSMANKFLSRRNNRDSQIRVSFNPENTTQIININRPSTSQSNSLRHPQLGQSYSQSVLERPNSTLLDQQMIKSTNFQQTMSQGDGLAFDSRDPVIISSKIINRNKVIINQIADMQTFLDRAKKQNQQALKGQRFLKNVQSGKSNLQLNPSSSLLAPKYTTQRDSIQDIKALQMKLQQVKEENKILQSTLDKQQQVNQAIITDQKRKNSKSPPRKKKKGSIRKEKIKFIEQAQDFGANQEDDQKNTNESKEDDLANIIIPQREFKIKRSQTQKILRSQGRLKDSHLTKELELVPEQSQEDIIQGQDNDLNQASTANDVNRYARVEKFELTSNHSIEEFSFSEVLQEVKQFGTSIKRLKKRKPFFKNSQNLAFLSQREDEIHLQLLQKSSKGKTSSHLENGDIQKQKNSSDLQVQTPKLSSNLSSRDLEMRFDIIKSLDENQKYLLKFRDKLSLQKILHKMTSSSAMTKDKKLNKQELEAKFHSDFCDLQISFQQKSQNGYLWIQESLMFKNISKKEKYPKVVIDLQNLTFSVNEPSQIFSPLLTMKSFNDQDSNYNLEQKINKNYKIQTFIQNTLKQYPTLFYNQDNKRKRQIDSMVLNRMCHYHMHYLRRVRRTVSIDLFQNLKDANISTDNLYRCDARDNFRASLLIDNRVMNQLHNFDKNNNLFKMRSGVPQPNQLQHDSTFHKILTSFHHPKIKKHKYKDDFYQSQIKVYNQRSLPYKVIRPVQNLIQESRYNFYSELLFFQPIYKFQYCHERDEKAARTEQKAMNKYQEYRRNQYYGKKAKLMMREYPKEYQIYLMMQSTKLDTAFFRDQSYQFQPEIMYLCLKVSRIHEQRISAIDTSNSSSISAKIKSERLKNILLAQKVAKQNLLGKKLSYKLGQKIYIQMAQTIEENYGQLDKVKSIKEVGLKQVFKMISRITYDNRFQIVELLEPVLVHEQYKYPNRMHFDFQPLHDVLLFQSLKKGYPSIIESKKKTKPGVKQGSHLLRCTPKNSSKQQIFSPAQNFESTANKIKEQKDKIQASSSQFLRNLKQEDRSEQSRNLQQTLGGDQVSKPKPNLLQLRMLKKKENDLLDELDEDNSKRNDKGNPESSSYSRLVKPTGINEEAFRTADNPGTYSSGMTLNNEPYKLTVEVWKKQKESNQSSPSMPKEQNDLKSPSTISQNLKPRITFQNQRPALSKFKNISSQSDTALDQSTKHLQIEQRQTAMEIQLFKSVSDAGKGVQQQQTQNSSNLLNKPLSNNLGIRRKSNTQIAIVLRPPIQAGSEENVNSGEDEILRDVLIDFYEYQKQGTQASQLKFEINNIQRQNSKIMMKKKTDQLRVQQERDYSHNKEIVRVDEVNPHKQAEKEKEKGQIKEKVEQTEKGIIGEKQPEKKGKIFAKNKPLIGEIKSQSFTDEYELLVRNLGKQKAQLCKVNKNSEINDKITQKTKSHNLVTRNGYMTCKDFKEQDDGTSYLNESFSFSSSEFSSLQQTIESKDETDSDVEEEELNDEEEHSSVVTSLNFKSLSSHLHKRYQRDNTYVEKNNLRIEEEGALLKKEHRKSGGEQQNQQNSLIKNIKNIKTQKYLTGSHSNDAFMDTFVSGQGEKKKIKKRISWFSKHSGKKKSELSSNSRFQSKKTKNMTINIEEDQMKKIIQAINQKNLISMKEYFKRFIGLNFQGWTDQEGNSLLHLCIGVNFIEGAEFLIHLGANINAQNNFGNTPLHNAKYLNSNKMVDFLIRYNARQAIKNSQGLTPWDINVN